MTADFTRLLDSIDPLPEDGVDNTLRLRVGEVTSVNGEGTLDVVIAGETLERVWRLANAFAPVGSYVQVLSYAGSMLVLGAVASGGAQGSMNKTGSTTTGPSAATTFTTAVSFGVTFPAAPNVHVNLRTAPAATSGWNFRAINITTTGFSIFGFGTSATFSEQIQWTAIYAP